ncbi:serine hydrolase [Plesiocystis pacifica]|uniref:serine hydrolase n=1 Tax=Plesiocystis pacifica TaxID=191768 RepID=UPI0012F7D68B|nr:serine hydrolase [Plesiocystis pacifica]
MNTTKLLPRALPCAALLTLAPLLSACPTSQGPSTAIASASDPFGTSDVPGTPSQTTSWRHPATLGNGLVSDSRLDLDAPPTQLVSPLIDFEAGVDWIGFVPTHINKIKAGFRPATVDALVTGSTIIGTNLIDLGLEDLSTYVADDDTAYRSETKTYLFDGLTSESAALELSGPLTVGMPRPTAIDTFSLDEGQLGTSLVWTHDNSDLPWRVAVGRTKANFEQQILAWGIQGYRLISVASRERNGVSEYAGIFVADGQPSGSTRISLGEDWSTLTNTANTNWADGYYPSRGTYEQGSEEPPRFNILWAKEPPDTQVETRYDMSKADFEAQDEAFRHQGFHLENGTAYLDGGDLRYAGVWMRSDEYWHDTVVGDTLGPGDPNFAVWTAVEAQAKASMDLSLDGKKEGKYFRPSGTLHIFEGDQLVLNRAYTYAPAYYPDTPLNAPMGLASVSKSITAAAVLDVLDDNNVALTDSFTGAASMFANVPLAMISVDIASALTNTGGFMTNPDSYLDQSMVHFSPHGSYPILGEELYDYVVLGGHLGVGGTDDYWNAGAVGQFGYSNPGYSLLGELVRVQSGMPYESYVRTQMLAPEGLDGDIYADPGHRKELDEPIAAGLRAYLINDDHPYVKNPGTPVEFGSTMAPLIAENDWRPNAGPVDPAAPSHAAWQRYAGGTYLGGAPLAAGGWHGDGESVGRLARAVATEEAFFPQSVADELWSPSWWVPPGSHSKGEKWAYGLGWYVRGQWVAMAGGFYGASAIALYNRDADVTIVLLTNTRGNGLTDFANPLIGVTSSTPGLGALGQAYPCVDDPATVGTDECAPTMGW